jgi:hypothetical protein
MKDARVANKIDPVDFFSPVAGRTASDELSLLDKDWMSNPETLSDRTSLVESSLERD